MKLVVEGPVATLYDGDNAVLKISTKDDQLTTEVLNTDIISDVEVSQMAEVVTGMDNIGDMIDDMCRSARKGKK